LYSFQEKIANSDSKEIHSMLSN